MRSRRTWLLGPLALALGTLFGLFHEPRLLEGEWTEQLEDWVEWPEQGPAVNLAADLKLMWETRPMTGQLDPSLGKSPNASTPDALHAAARVFKTVPLLGLTRDEVVAKLGDPRRSNNSVYNFPWYDVRPGVLIYRFDTGGGGWQFNLYFDEVGRVRRVQRLEIE